MTDEDTREAEAAAYRDGYRAGYTQGITDGAGQGYSDAKTRAWIAHDVLSGNSEMPNHWKVKVAEALTALVGKRQ